MLQKRDKLNNFQRKETARWLLNISQAAAIGGAGALFVPSINDQIGVIGGVASTSLAVYLYLLAMFIGREVKDDN